VLLVKDKQATIRAKKKMMAFQEAAIKAKGTDEREAASLQ